jgi:uncharacterized protein YjiK
MPGMIRGAEVVSRFSLLRKCAVVGLLVTLVPTVGTSPPGVSAAPPTTVDLSTYVRVGRFDLPEPTRTPPPLNSLLAQEVSAVTYNPVTDSLFVVGDGGRSIVQVSKSGALIDSMTLALGASPQGTEFYDTEGLTYVGGNDQFVFVEERDRQVSKFTYVAGTTLQRSDVQTVDLGTFVENIGIEGISYDPLTLGLIAVKETQPEGIFQTNVDFAAGTATNGSPTTVNSIDLFDPALAGLADFADVYALSNLPSMAGQPQEGNLLVLSQESGKVVNIDRSGSVSSALTIISDPGNPLSVPNQQHEGLTMDHDGNLYVVSENGGGDIDHPQLWVYSPSTVPNQAPTAIALANQVNSILENTSTATRLKVADVIVTDDGLGTNNLTVTGPDSGFFEVDSNGLYVKAGTVLDFETKNSYTVSIEVDDPTIGAAPDATSAPFTLAVTDVVDESTSLQSVVISEVSPWSSGSSPYLADWFEVTNTGTTSVDLTGWSMDDNSNDFALSVALNGVTSIAPGKSAIFIEGDATKVTGFESAWFAGVPPVGFTIGTYSGGGVGLSTGGDAVNLFDASGNRVTGIAFGISTTGRTFDNTAGAGSTTLPLPIVSRLSAVAVNGAFVATDGIEIGSPGTKTLPVFVSEVAPWGSGNATYAADWFEVTNFGVSALDITGWKMDDSSNSPVGAVPLNGVTSIASGQSVIFIEGDTTKAAAFTTAWFGTTPPAGFAIGTYTGSGVGLSTTADAVNLFDASGRRVTGASFLTSPPTAVSFDNATGLDSAISALSAVGINGAFQSSTAEVGSPGTIAQVPIISEVAPWGSGNATYAADWFEVTNLSATALDITGWKMDDTSNSSALSVALNGITSIAPGQSVIFIEGDATRAAAFTTAWFGATAPAGFAIGTYSGGGVGLGTGGDAVNLFDATGKRVTGVNFGASTTGVSFDNAAAVAGTISKLSVVGINGAFRSPTLEIGSPGTTDPDITPPTVTYTGNAGTYTVDQPINITCLATDELAGSGIASTTCANIVGPAAGFGLGAHPFSATATDNAGNTGSGSGNFTVTVTPASLCSLTLQYVHGSVKYQSLPARPKTAFDQTVTALCAADLTPIKPGITPAKKKLLVGLYKIGVSGFASGGWLTRAQADQLSGFASAL